MRPKVATCGAAGPTLAFAAASDKPHGNAVPAAAPDRKPGGLQRTVEEDRRTVCPALKPQGGPPAVPARLRGLLFRAEGQVPFVRPGILSILLRSLVSVSMQGSAKRQTGTRALAKARQGTASALAQASSIKPRSGFSKTLRIPRYFARIRGTTV
jgi:hypothetical protein